MTPATKCVARVLIAAPETKKVVRPDMKTIKYMPVIGGRQRSMLMNLTKEQIVDAIIQQSGAYGWPVIEAKLGLQKMSDPFAKTEVKLNRRTANWMSRSMTYAVDRKKQLMAIPRERLVKLTYWFSDMNLNRRYRSGQKTLNLEAGIQLEDDRKIELDKASLQKMLRKSKREKAKVKAKSEPKAVVKKTKVVPMHKKITADLIKEKQARVKRKLSNKEKVKIERDVSKARTTAWIKSLRSHLRYMGTDADTTKVD